MHASTALVGLAAAIPLVAAQVALQCDTYVYAPDNYRYYNRLGYPAYDGQYDYESARYFQGLDYNYEGVAAYVWANDTAFESLYEYESAQYEYGQEQKSKIAECKAKHSYTSSPTSSAWAEETKPSHPHGPPHKPHHPRQMPASEGESYSEEPSYSEKPSHGEEEVDGEEINSTEPELVPVYRWYSADTNDYYYTTDPDDILSPYGYTFQGARFYIVPNYVPEGGDYNYEGQYDVAPLFTWYNPDCGTHFYTTDPQGDNAVASGFFYEDILGYVRVSPGFGSEPLFRWEKAEVYQDGVAPANPGGVGGATN